MSLKLAVLAFCFSFFTQASFATTEFLATNQVPANLQAGTFAEPIDHSGDLTQTFNQRFWIDSEYAVSENAPVLLRICGEGAGEDFLNDMTPAFAKKLGAHVIYLEHRYYGKSQPFNDLSADHMKYLTLNNVIEDIATFQKWISKDRKINGKWITTGGSYSGTISALYRFIHPELVVGALAASAPMVSKPAHESNSDIDSLSSINLSDYEDSGDRQWAYQACSTFGFWMMMQGPYFLEPGSILCDQLFGIKIRADKSAYNTNYYLPFISNTANAPTHILFTNGTRDGWSKISIDAADNQNPGIIVKLIQGAGHHYDLNPEEDSAEVLAARNLFLQLAQSWLQ